MTSSNPNIRNGSTRSGSHHWWMQRLSAVALIPLSLWFMSVLVWMPLQDYERLLIWMSELTHAVPLLVMVAALIYHASLGMQVVLEDYISHHGLKLSLIFLTKFIFIVLGVVSILSISKVYFLLS
ncbi:MAG: succinate dehydrogenase, hydrophobic membrane anchor protein [Alphaproteobacteria bacterium]|nr:succinate dehydrogenase, hydrophobic membrane anchor protein [Alphaproteobacteria bacterium]